jgi:hypothetical protein
MQAKLKNILVIICISFVPTLFIWIPFFLRLKTFWTIPLSQDGMATIVANYDGPLYLVVAKTLYNTLQIKNYAFGLPVEYYAAHFPLFPLLIRAFSPLLGYPYSMLFVTLISSFFAILYFSKLIADFVDKKDVAWITFTFAVFPARWLIVRSVGSADPLFLAAILATLYYFRKDKYWLAGLSGAIATFTKSPAILLFVSLTIAFIIPRFKNYALAKKPNILADFELKKYVPLLLMPISLLIIFAFYKIQFNDWFAYFHSGDNIHLFFPPFQIFNYSAPWVGTFWLEEVIFVYIFGVLGLMELIRKKELALSWFVGIFFTSTLFIAHRDLIRYSLPIIPFIFVGFSQFMVKKEFKIALALIIIPIFLFSLAFISNNVMPIPDWQPLL